MEIIQVKKFDKDFKNQIIKEPVGDKLTHCFTCGTCIASCPVRAIDEEFNPRKIIRMCVLGMKEVVLKSDFIWLCTSCYLCQERYLQDVMITELMSG
jgi:heterodisulfide reductase subunit C